MNRVENIVATWEIDYHDAHSAKMFSDVGCKWEKVYRLLYTDTIRNNADTICWPLSKIDLHLLPIFFSSNVYEWECLNTFQHTKAFWRLCRRRKIEKLLKTRNVLLLPQCFQLYSMIIVKFYISIFLIKCFQSHLQQISSKWV